MKKKITKTHSSIEERNKAFNKLSIANKKIAIAKDVIISLKAKKMYATNNGYFFLNLDGSKFNFKTEGLKKVDLQDIIHNKALDCSVCAIGGIFAAKVNIANQCKVTLRIKQNIWNTKMSADSLILNDEELIQNLKGIFTEKELRAIEYAFEGCDIGDTFTHDENFPDEKYKQFYKKYKTSNNRMIAIMNNIIKNEGTFKI